MSQPLDAEAPDAVDDERDEIAWRGDLPTYDEACDRYYALRLGVEWYRTQAACFLFAALQAEANLQEFKDQLRALMAPAVRRPPPIRRRAPRRRHGPRRVSA